MENMKVEDNEMEIAEGELEVEISSELQKEKKPKMKEKILKRIFRQDEVTDSTPEGPPVDHSNAHHYGLLPNIKFQDVEIPCLGENNFVKGWLMEPDDSVLN